MKIAVTGGGGFIGRHVADELTRRGMAATLVLRPGASARVTAGGHRVVHLDILQPPTDAFERMGRPEALIHLAWGGLPNYRSLHHFETELPAQYAFTGAGRPSTRSSVPCGNASQSRALPSAPPVTTVRPLGAKPTVVTASR